MRHIQAILEYLSHIKLTHAIHRNLLLLRLMKARSEAAHLRMGVASTEGGKMLSGKAAKPEEFVRVYDILLQVREGREGDNVTLCYAILSELTSKNTLIW